MQTAFSAAGLCPQHAAGHPGLRWLVTLLWSIGINGDNAVDVVVAPIFLQYLAANIDAMTDGTAAAVRDRVRLLHDVRERRRHRRDACAGAAARRLFRGPGFRKVSRLSLPTQVFQINEPIFFGLPIVLNPVFMIPYVLNALLLTTGSYLLMHWGLIHKPFVNVPWTTPPDHRALPGDRRRLASGGLGCRLDRDRDAVYFPFARAAERARLRLESRGERLLDTRSSGSGAPLRAGTELVISRSQNYAAVTWLAMPVRVDDLLDGPLRPAQSPRRPTPQKMRTFHTAEEFARATGGKVAHRAHARSGAAGGAAPGADVSWPTTEFTVIAVRVAVGHVGRHAAGRDPPQRATTRRASTSPACAGCRTTRHRHRLRRSRRRGSRRRSGYARIEYVPMTLADKSRVFVDRIQARHNRWGLTADSHLRVPGDLSTNQMVSSDNDGLWTAMYVAAECFRFKVTGDADARENARRGMQAIVRLEAITGNPGIPCALVHQGGRATSSPATASGTTRRTRRGAGRATPAPTRSSATTSSIRSISTWWPTKRRSRRCAPCIDRITNHILDNNYQLIDVDGKRTRWGWWGPTLIWEDPDETGLRALHMLSHLRVAMHMTAANASTAAQYQAAYDDLIKTHRYHLLTRNQKVMVPGRINHSDDELAFLSYYPLLRYENGSRARSRSTSRAWSEAGRSSGRSATRCGTSSTRPAPARRSSTATSRCARCARSRWTRSSGPSATRTAWTCRSIPLTDRFKRRQALIVLPYDELPMSKWNGNPYNLDGGNGGRSEDDGAYFLLPYWMGRYPQADRGVDERRDYDTVAAGVADRHAGAGNVRLRLAPVSHARERRPSGVWTRTDDRDSSPARFQPIVSA